MASSTFISNFLDVSLLFLVQDTKRSVDGMAKEEKR